METLKIFNHRLDFYSDVDLVESGAGQFDIY